MTVSEGYRKLSDEELVARYQDGDDNAAEFLIDKYKNLVRKCARSYYLIGADHEDLLQEGMIGLFKAIRAYKPDRDAVFMTFATLCVGRHIRSAVASYNRKSNEPLNNSVSLEAVMEDRDGKGKGVTRIEAIADKEASNPEVLILSRERAELIKNEIRNNLSKFEKQVLELYDEGFSYARIGEILGKSAKAIDNAIQRIRNKISKNY